MKTKLFILLFASLCFSQLTLAEEILITITANGVRTEYKLSTLGKIVLDDKYSEDPLFNVHLKGKQTLTKIRAVEITQASIPTDIQDIKLSESQETPIIYTNDKTIIVLCNNESDISFYSILGQQLGETVRATRCECQVSIPGAYNVIVGDYKQKIMVE